MQEYDTATVYVTPLRRRLRLFWRVLGTTFDVGLMVVGSALIALAAVVMLDGFEVVDLGLTTSTGAMLGSSLVIAVFGAFAIGVAVEGPVRQVREFSANEIELAAARGIALLVSGIVLLIVGRIGLDHISGLPFFIPAFTEGTAAFTWTLVVGLAALWGVRRVYADRSWLDQIELPMLYIVWAIGVMVVYGVLV